MKIVNFKEEELKNLETYIPEGLFKNQEAYFYHYQNFLLKYFITRSEEYFNTKLFNLSSIINNEELFSNKDIIIPKTLFSVESVLKGYVMPYLENTKSLEVIFNSNISIKEKIELLKSAYSLIKKVHEIKINGKNVFVGDIHAGNFIYNEKTNTLSLVDTDSFYISGSTPLPSKYLVNSSIIKAFPLKYKPYRNGLIIPNENTDLFSFIIMFLNVISKTDFSLVDLSSFYEYLDYLKTLGLSDKFIFSILKIYTNETNENPLNYIEKDEHTKLELANIETYKEKTGKSLILKR